MKTYIFIVKFFFIAGLFIVSNHNLHLNDTLERNQFLTIYFEWLRGLFTQSVTVTGYVMNSRWLPQANQTFVAPQEAFIPLYGR